MKVGGKSKNAAKMPGKCDIEAFLGSYTQLGLHGLDAQFDVRHLRYDGCMLNRGDHSETEEKNGFTKSSAMESLKAVTSMDRKPTGCLVLDARTKTLGSHRISRVINRIVKVKIYGICSTPTSNH